VAAVRRILRSRRLRVGDHMALDDDIRTLSGVALFQSLSREHLRLLAFGADHIDAPAGHRLYREGDIAESAFVMEHGEVGLFHTRDDGERLHLDTVRPGDVLSELALIAESQRLTEAVAITDARLLRLDRRLFMRIVEEYPGLASTLYDRIASDLQALVRKLDRLSPHFDG
jgi:CRP-like cAMP-binding protein